MLDGDTLAIALRRRLRISVNPFSALLTATVTGSTIRVFYTAGRRLRPARRARTEIGSGCTRMRRARRLGTRREDLRERDVADEVERDARFQLAAGDNYSGFVGHAVPIPTNVIRKMRWTYAADLQAGAFVRSEFQVVVANWTVTGTNRTYSVAGPGSRRVEDRFDGRLAGVGRKREETFRAAPSITTTTPGDSLSCTYQATQSHTLYLGLRYTGNWRHGFDQRGRGCGGVRESGFRGKTC